MKPPYRAGLGGIGAQLANMAARYEASARIGAQRLPFRARWAVLAAAGIYGDIAREVARRGPAAWNSRVITTKSAKLGWVARALVQSRSSVPDAPREGLWSRYG
jgi:15-cis-phytoene synthase